jgi:hypothetical protein
MLSVINLEINGAQYPIRYDVNALSEYEEITGKSFVTIFSEENDMGIRALFALAYVGMKCGHNFQNKIIPFSQSREQLGGWIPIKKLKEFIPIACQFVIGERVEDAPTSTEAPGE